MYNNYNNDNFNNNPKPLFSNEFPSVEVNNDNSNLFNNSNDFINPSQDTPPALEPIKNLNEATIVNAPTLDTLAPMNIMPESFENRETVKVDALDAYDSGINYGTMASSSINNDLFNPTPSISDMQSVENNIEPLPVSFNAQTIENNFTPSSVSFDTPNIDDNIEINSTSFEIPKLGNYENSEINQVIPESNDLDPQNFNTVIEQENNELDINPVISEGPINNLNIEYDVHSNANDEKSFEESTNGNNPYEIMQDKIEKDNLMLNLGIDNAYDDTDMLDIVDIDEENKEESNNVEKQEISEEDKDQEEKPLILDNIEEIKELINKIKEKGIKIELEEFDFEHMYQLIVKIEK